MKFFFPFCSRLVFTVISEPSSADGDCVDIAFAMIDLLQVSSRLCSAQRQG